MVIIPIGLSDIGCVEVLANNESAHSGPPPMEFWLSDEKEMCQMNGYEGPVVSRSKNDEQLINELGSNTANAYKRIS